VLETLTNLIVRAMDVLLGSLLRLPSDVQLFTIALGSALILALVRLWTTDQDLLRRCRHDKARLKTLLREAKKRGDREAMKRHRATSGAVALKQLRQEARPLLASLLPLVLLATWSFERLAFHPLKAGEPFEFAARFPLSAIGEIAHLVPTPGLRTHNGWIQEISAATRHGAGVWQLTADGRREPYPLRLRIDESSLTHPVRVAAPTYEEPLQRHSGSEIVTEVRLRPIQLFGVVPGIAPLHFPPWLVAYLMLVIPATWAFKKALRIV